MGPRRKQGRGRRLRPGRRPPGVQGHEEAVREAAADRVRLAVAEAMVRTMAQEPTVRGLSAAVQDAYAIFDDHMATAVFAPPLACRRGCTHCCYNQISLSEPEALFLGLYVFERFGPERLAQVEADTRAVLDRIRGLTRRQVGDIRHLVPCPLLEDGACSVHPARPLACRGWNAVDADQCRRSVADNDPLALIEHHPFPRRLADAIQAGLLQGSQELGLEAGYLVITRALSLMRGHGLARCAGDWLEKKPFFALWSE